MTLKPNQRFVSEEKKRAVCDEWLGLFLAGENALVLKLNRGPEAVQVRMASQNDRARLLDRIMREPGGREAIVELTSALVTSQDERWQRRLTEPERMMCDEWDREGKAALLEVHFVRFEPPTREGWPQFYAEFKMHLLNGTPNKRHLMMALEKQWPLEITYTLYKQELIRFHILEPYAADQKGKPLIEIDVVKDEGDQ